METKNPEPGPQSGKAAGPSGGELTGQLAGAGNNSAPGAAWRGLSNAARFWEPRRLLYNLLLFAVVVIWVAKTWPHFRPAMTWEALGIMTVLALLANVCYCAAYLAEILIQSVGTRTSWNRRRWVVWVLGTSFAILFENYWIADEIYPYVSK